MSDKPALPRNVQRLKQDAKKLAKGKGISHSAALSEIAQGYGFPNWQALLKADISQPSNNTTPSHLSLQYENGLVIHNREILARHGIDYGLLTITATGIDKSIMDAVASLREYFKLKDYHDYTTQLQGQIEKREAKLVTNSGEFDTSVTLYRPKTKKGDPRIWVYGLKKHVQPDDILAIIVHKQILYVFNISQVDLANLGGLLSTFQIESEQVALELLARLREMARRGPLKAIKTGDTAIGMTIEHALGIEANCSKAPDYKGIELKSARQKEKQQKNRATIFTQVADWPISPLKSSREVIDKYGYIRNGDLRLYCTISTKVANSQGLQFELREQEDLLVEKHLTDGDILYWRGETLRKRLLEKHSATFWIKAEVQIFNNEEYYILKSVIYTKNPLVSQFMQLLKEGIITMDHAIKKKGGIGSAAEKGPLFKIRPEHLGLLFPEPREYTLVD